ncbi:MAG: cell division protein [Pseudomonadota bacterium]|nr:cell division protein [Sphingomonas sp.]MDQ3482632.1 cell division protein [Pseudomonadota bacterium]
MNLERIWRGPEARLLPIEKLHVPTVAVMAIMTFAMLVVATAGLALANAASVVSSGVENRYVVELPAAAKAELPRIVAAVRSSPGVRAATPVPEAEMRRTLERWLGEAASSPDLPVPSLVILELDPGAETAAVERNVRARVPSARLISETAELRPLLRSLSAFKWLAISLVSLMAAATAAAIVLAARGALDTHRPTVEIMHGIGATDAQLTRLFERKIAVDAIAGAALGAAGAAAVLLLVGGAGAALAGDLTATAPLGATDLLLLALVPLAAILLAVAIAHWTLLGALRATL